MIKILLADDHELVRTGIEAILNACDDICVVGVAKSGEEAVEKVSVLSVDVVLMDIDMPGIGGVEACRQILQNNAEAKIIVISVNNNSHIPPELFKLGVSGFISKESPVEEMINAIRKVVSGDRYLSFDTVYNLASRCLPEYYESPFLKLSRREAEVVTLILQGKSIKEMSNMLILSDKTVNTYRYRLYDKLKIKNDVELTRLAYKVGYFETALI
ncbi:MAG: response regulator [Methylococcales bacterium]|jgi:two-component system invasion response regulator UvrY|nr:MAG: response regulator [Methylococcales bacterium]